MACFSAVEGNWRTPREHVETPQRQDRTGAVTWRCDATPRQPHARSTGENFTFRFFFFFPQKWCKYSLITMRDTNFCTKKRTKNRHHRHEANQAQNIMKHNEWKSFLVHKLKSNHPCSQMSNTTTWTRNVTRGVVRKDVSETQMLPPLLFLALAFDCLSPDSPAVAVCTLCLDL